jgi:uncharacterized protein
MDFLDRTGELKRLEALSARPSGGFAVLWGRRRVGKTRLLLEWVHRKAGVYFVADQSAAPLQRRALAEALGSRLPGFAEVVYPDWSSLLSRAAADAARLNWRGPMVLDEFPYLVDAAPELPSVLQRWLDHEAGRSKLITAISGSSQRMMQGLILDRNAPLFGRAVEAFRLPPLEPGYLMQAFPGLSPVEAVSYYAAWGGIPRYWELMSVSGAASLDEAVDAMVLDPQGILHQEPDRLLLEETPSAMVLRPLLEVIGLGAHRLTEMAGRLGSPVTSLSRPMARLLEMDLVRRENPFRETEKTGKRSLYRIDDPFFRMWYRVVAPRRALFAQASPETRIALWRKYQEDLAAEEWENLCRRAVPLLKKGPLSKYGPWLPASRWWRGQGPEWDIVSLSLDGKHLLLGEAKWRPKLAGKQLLTQASEELAAKGVPQGLLKPGTTVHHVLFFPLPPREKVGMGTQVLGAHEVLGALGG